MTDEYREIIWHKTAWGGWDGMEMTDELIALLKELNAANKCTKCGGSGQKNELRGTHYFKSDCHTCHGTGAKVPDLNRTKSVMMPSFGPRVTTYHERPRWNDGIESDGLPFPTVEEVLEMLPYSIKTTNGEDVELEIHKGKSDYIFAYENERFIWSQECSDSPLTAALKLLKWWMGQ